MCYTSISLREGKMSTQHVQKFESCMIEYCSAQAERAYNLFEDDEIDNGMEFLAHLADVLQLMKESKTITEFALRVQELNELDKDSVYSHLHESGFGQYIPE